MRLRIVGVVVFIAAYVASIVLSVSGGMGHPHQVTESPASSGGTTAVSYTHLTLPTILLV